MKGEYFSTRKEKNVNQPDQKKSLKNVQALIKHFDESLILTFDWLESGY